MYIYDPISLVLNLDILSKDGHNNVYLTPLEKTSTKTHNAPNKGIKFDKQWCEKISKSLRGRTSPMKGTPLPSNHPFKDPSRKRAPRSEATKEKIRQKLLGIKRSNLTKEKLSKTRKEKFISGEIVHPKGTKGKVSPLKGKSLSQAHKDKISATKKAKHLSHRLKQDNI